MTHRFIAAALVLAGVIACPTRAHADGFPALKVSKGARSVVLVGSQHAGRSEPARARAVDKLVAESTGVCVEADPRDPATVQAGAHLLMNPPGVRLRDRLSATTYQAARRHLTFLPPSAGNIDGLSPYGLSTLLAYNVRELRTQLVALKPAASMDAEILGAAQRHNKPVVAIEKRDAVAASLAQLSDRDWDTYIAGIIEILDCERCVANYGTNMVAAYSLTSDYESVNRNITKAFDARPTLYRIYDKIYFNPRNEVMARAIEHDAVEGGRCSLIAIGIGHLGGERGVVAHLRRMGLQVTPFDGTAR